jgi:hypothetical protein
MANSLPPPSPFLAPGTSGDQTVPFAPPDPSTLYRPAEEHGAADAPSPTQRMPRVRDRAASARPAAGWLAIVGSVLILVAAAVVAVGNWQSLSAPVRLAGLVTGGLAVAWLADRNRRSLPVTATVVAHLAAALAAPIGVVGASTFEQRWPICLIVGGVLALIAGELQSGRWNRTSLLYVSASAATMALAGLSAVVSVPIGVLVATSAVGALVVDRRAQARLLAVCGGLAPLMELSAQAKVGPGTISRLGATGEMLSWAAPVAGLLAGGVLVWLARRDRSRVEALGGAAVVGFGVIVGGGVANLSSTAWLALAGFAVAGVLAAAKRLHSDPMWAPLLQPFAEFLAVASLTFVGALSISVLAHSVAGAAVPDLTVALMAWMFAGSVGSLGRWNRTDADFAVDRRLLRHLADRGVPGRARRVGGGRWNRSSGQPVSAVC